MTCWRCQHERGVNDDNYLGAPGHDAHGYACRHQRLAGDAQSDTSRAGTAHRLLDALLEHEINERGPGAWPPQWMTQANKRLFSGGFSACPVSQRRR
jgi:hypothetical protein